MALTLKELLQQKKLTPPSLYGDELKNVLFTEFIKTKRRKLYPKRNKNFNYSIGIKGKLKTTEQLIMEIKKMHDENSAYR